MSRVVLVRGGGTGIGRSIAEVKRAGTPEDVSYTYDADGNLTAQSVTAPGNPAAGTHTYGYDQAGKLTSWTAPGQATVTYGYDQAGNRTSAAGQTAVYDARNRLISDGTHSYGWTPRGTLAAVDAISVNFDALGRQAGYGTSSYQYDGLDRLTAKDTTHFAYAGLELDPVVAGSERYARTPAGDLLALADQTGQARIIGENRHGDLAWLTDPATGTVTGTRVWSPTGQPAGQTGSDTTSLGYQSDWTDPISGQVWMGARWYQPNTATFTSRDNVFGMLRTPIGLNRYTYAQGDPLQFFDPDGHWPKILDDAINAGKAVVGGAVDAAGQAVGFVNRTVVQPVVRGVTATVEAVRSGVATVGRTVKNGVVATARGTAR